MLKNFVTIYSKTQTAQWRSVKELAEKLDIVDSTTQTAEEYLKAQGVEGKFVDEMVDAATRANYGQVRFVALLFSCVHRFTVTKKIIRTFPISMGLEAWLAYPPRGPPASARATTRFSNPF